MGYRRVDGQLGQVTQDSEVVVVGGVLRQFTLELAHLVGSLKQAREILAHPAHRLGVRSVHADDTHIVEDILGGHRFRTDTTLRECYILRHPGAQVVVDHQHVHVFRQRVDGIGTRWVGRRRQHVEFGGDADDVGGVAAAGAFRVIGVYRPASDGRDGVLNETGFVQGVGVNCHRDVVTVGHLPAAVDGGGGGSPIFAELQAAGAGFQLFLQGRRVAGVALAQQPPVDRAEIRRLRAYGACSRGPERRWWRACRLPGRYRRQSWW